MAGGGANAYSDATHAACPHSQPSFFCRALLLALAAQVSLQYFASPCTWHVHPACAQRLMLFAAAMARPPCQ